MSLKSPFSYIYRKVIYAHAIHCRRHLNYYTQFCLAWKVYKNVKYLPNRSEGVQCYPVFMLCRMSAKSILPPKMTIFPSIDQGIY